MAEKHKPDIGDGKGPAGDTQGQRLWCECVQCKGGKYVARSTFFVHKQKIANGEFDPETFMNKRKRRKQARGAPNDLPVRSVQRSYCITTYFRPRAVGCTTICPFNRLYPTKRDAFK